MSSVRNAEQIANLVDRKGFKAPEADSFKEVDFRGKRVSKATAVKENLAKGGVLGILERGGRLLAGAVATVGTLGTANASKTFRESTWEAGVKGVVKRTLYLETGKQDSKTAKIQGFDPKDRATIIKYLEIPKNKQDLRETPEGHQYLPLPSKSGFILVPNGEMDKATYIKLWSNKSGKPIKNQSEFYRAIRSYCITHQDVQKTIEKIAKEKGISIEEARGKIDTVVISTKLPSVRLYESGKLNPNKKMDYWSGTSVDLSKETKESLNKLHEKDGAKYSEHLDPKERPFAPPKHPRPSANDGDDSDDDNDAPDFSLNRKPSRTQRSNVLVEEPTGPGHVPSMRTNSSAGVFGED